CFGITRSRRRPGPIHRCPRTVEKWIPAVAGILHTGGNSRGTAMLIVDAQVHIWGADTPERPWPKSGRSRPHRPLPFSKDDLLREMDTAGVARVVIVPPSWAGHPTDWALEAARLHPNRFAVMGRPPLVLAERHLLDRWRDQPGMLGIRVTASAEGAGE